MTLIQNLHPLFTQNLPPLFNNKIKPMPALYPNVTKILGLGAKPKQIYKVTFTLITFVYIRGFGYIWIY